MEIPSNRRQFLKTASLTAAATSLQGFAIGKEGESANSKINVAVVGCGGMGGYAVKEGAKQNLVAMCDVDDERASKAYSEHPGANKYKDFRIMLDEMDKEIDAVSISTPDHTHFPIAMAAMERGKHVFVQKPLAHNIWQIRKLRDAAKKYGVITQMGNQGHTFDGMRRIKEWVGGGILGDVTEVIAWTNRPNSPYFVTPQEFPVKTGPVPPHPRLGPLARPRRRP